MTSAVLFKFLPTFMRPKPESPNLKCRSSTHVTLPEVLQQKLASCVQTLPLQVVR